LISLLFLDENIRIEERKEERRGGKETKGRKGMGTTS